MKAGGLPLRLLHDLPVSVSSSIADAPSSAQLFFMLMTAQPCFLNTNPVGLATNHQSRASTP